MKHSLVITAMAVMMVGCANAGGEMKTAGKNMSHVHIRHVSTAWQDTPNKMGLMTTAKAEAKIAAQHAKFAANKPNDLAWMKMHTRHVIHAVDASKIDKGPGLGYGVIKAANGVAKHITLAASSPEATDYLKLHSVHVATSAQNTAKRGEQILKLTESLLATSSTREAAELSMQISSLSQQLLAGVDANGDGKITWHENEGGLLESEKHLGFIIKNEAL